MNTPRHSVSFLRYMVAVLLLTFGAALSTTAFAQSSPKTNETVFRVGWQKGSHLALLKSLQSLEKRLESSGVSVTWIEFTAGPQMLEGLNVGSIDFACVGETPPVFAQAAGAPLLYVANEPPAPEAEKVLVPKNSTLRSFGELKGKRIVLNRGSNVHYLLLKLLAKENLKYSDVNVVYLPPADARAAFENGSVDAWVIWDPFAEAAIVQTGARVLAEAKATPVNIAENYNFYLTTQAFAQQHPEILKQTVDELKKMGEWVPSHLDEAAALLAPQIGLTPAIAKSSLSHYGYGVLHGFPIGAKVIANQQAIADAFFEQKLIPKKLEVQSVVWKPF
ncbi:MAG: sulfonate ABC transporter substrate-binding protein [Burkholderiales bacterium]|jgi:sulfonate transport system substrate-binding protein|nr:sulfonate ABC transporter substrate-binding protein [Burkholderiales bacterium]